MKPVVSGVANFPSTSGMAVFARGSTCRGSKAIGATGIQFGSGYILFLIYSYNNLNKRTDCCRRLAPSDYNYSEQVFMHTMHASAAPKIAQDFLALAMGN
jgi:hypothetical protein